MISEQPQDSAPGNHGTAPNRSTAPNRGQGGEPEENGTGAKPTGTDRRELQASVLRLLRHALREAATGIDSGFVDNIVPILGKSGHTLDDGDEKALWMAYQRLSKAILPASDESLKLKEYIEQEDWNHAANGKEPPTGLVRAYRDSYRRFRLLLWGVGLLFLFLQGYALLLSSLLDGIEEQHTALTNISARILTVRQANPEMAEDKQPLQELIYQREWIKTRMVTDHAALRRISFPWGGLYAYNETATGPGGPAAALDGPTMHAFYFGARSVLGILSHMVLPTILGLLGSLAYVIRGILDSFSRSSLTLGSRRRWETRVSLGGLLGLITGAMFPPGLDQTNASVISPLVWAFLVGYSVEFAFSIFDTVIERGRETLSANRGKMAGDPPEVHPVAKPQPVGKVAGGP